MAQTTTNIAIGAATFFVGPWVTAAGSSTLVEMGHTKEGTKLKITYNDYGMSSEQSFGILRKLPQDAKVILEAHVMEATLDNMRIALRQPTANLSGSAPNKTLLFGDIVEQYHQCQFITKGVGATTPATRTGTFWRGSVESLGDVVYTKKGEQLFVVTFDMLYDGSVATSDKFGKVVDSGGS